MSPMQETNRILSKISVAARTALAHPRNVEIAHFIGAGPSIRARARLALAAAFMVAAPTLFIGVMRTEDVAEHAARLSEFDDYLKKLLETRIAVKELDVAMWAYTVEREFENGQAVVSASDHLRKSIEQLVAERPPGLDIGPRGFLEGLALRLDGLIKRSIANRGSMAQARLSIITMSKEIKTIEKRVVDIGRHERILALGSLSLVGRDQLILFLVLLFAVPVFVGFVPGWLVAPLSRLRQIASRIETGQLKEMPISGRDEVAVLARSLKTHFQRRDELDQKKSSKIFEMRNVLRAVINRVKEPVFIVDDSTKINYTNDAAASLVGLPSHQMEGKLISDCMYSAEIKKACENAFSGDVTNDEIAVNMEVSDGRSYSLHAKMGVVRNRDGEISRAVLVFYRNESEKRNERA